MERFRKSALSPLPEGLYYLSNCSDNSGLIVSAGGNFAGVTCSDDLRPAVIEVQNYGYQTRLRNKETGYYINRYEFNDNTLILQLKSMAGGDASWLLDYISENEYILRDEFDHVLTMDPETGNLLMAPYSGESNQIWKFTEYSG